MNLITHPSQLPSIDRVLQHSTTRILCEQYGHDAVVRQLRNSLENLRTRFQVETTQKTGANCPAVDAEVKQADTNQETIIEHLIDQTSIALATHHQNSLRPIYNLTGTVLHTNLGRAPYPQEALNAMQSVSGGWCNLEFDLQRGSRGRRDDHVERWICELTGAEAATTINNNARRFFPNTCHYGKSRMQTARSRHHQSNPFTRLRKCNWQKDGCANEGAHQQLRS